MKPSVDFRFVYFKSRFIELLKELESKNVILKPEPEQIRNFIKILTITRIHDTICDNFTKEIISREENKSSDSLYIFTIIDSFNRHTEIFKLAFLLILKKGCGINDRTTLGQLIKILETLAPVSFSVIKNDIELELRNAFSHQTYWFEDKDEITYCEDSSLNNQKSIDIESFVIKYENQVIIEKAFVQVLEEWVC